MRAVMRQVGGPDRGRRIALTLLAAVAGAGVAGCSLLPPQAGVLRPADCFGDVPYSFSGWTTLAEIGQTEGPADGRVFALVSRDEVVLTVSPPAADGSTFSLVGRGVCWTWPEDGQVSKGALGEIHRQPNP